MVSLLNNRSLGRLVMTISLSLTLALGTNLTIVNAYAYASNQSSDYKASISLEQTTPNNDKVVQQQKLGAAEDESAQSNSENLKAVTGKPKSVTGLVTKVESDDQVDLEWNEVSGATSYKIYRSTKATGDDYKRIGTSTTTSFSDNGLKSKATYYYEVSAVNEVREGNRSNPVLGSTKVPEKVTNLTVAVISDSQLDLNWKAVSGALSYEIYRSGSSSGNYTSIGSSETNSYSNEDLMANASYYYKVSAVNGVGEGKGTSAVLGETKAPGQVTSLHVKVIDDSRLELSWKAVSGAESYEIYCSSSSSGNSYTDIGTSTTTNFVNRGLKDRTTYYYRVSAVNNIGEGKKSNTASGKTK